MDVDALRNASIKSGAGFGTLSMAMVTLMRSVPPDGFFLFAASLIAANHGDQIPFCTN
jgi:hypothetical protein